MLKMDTNSFVHLPLYVYSEIPECILFAFWLARKWLFIKDPKNLLLSVSNFSSINEIKMQFILMSCRVVPTAKVVYIWQLVAISRLLFLFLDLESKTLQGIKEDLSLDGTKQYILQNTIIDFQKLTEKEILRIVGPLEADFTVKVRK